MGTDRSVCDIRVSNFGSRPHSRRFQQHAYTPCCTSHCSCWGGAHCASKCSCSSTSHCASQCSNPFVNTRWTCKRCETTMLATGHTCFPTAVGTESWGPTEAITSHPFRFMSQQQLAALFQALLRLTFLITILLLDRLILRLILRLTLFEPFERTRHHPSAVAVTLAPTIKPTPRQLCHRQWRVKATLVKVSDHRAGPN